MHDPYRTPTNIRQHHTKCSHLDAIFVAKQPKLGLGHKFVEVFKLHTHLVELLWTSGQFVEEASAYTTHNKHKKRKSVHSAGFEPAVPADK